MIDDALTEERRLGLHARILGIAAVAVLGLALAVSVPRTVARHRHLEWVNRDLLEVQTEIVTVQAKVVEVESRIIQTQQRIKEAVNGGSR